VGNIQYANFAELGLRANDLRDVPESDLHSVLRKRESYADSFLEVTLMCRADSAGLHEFSVALSPMDAGAESGCVVELKVRVT
jgi:hypothetical protein